MALAVITQTPVLTMARNNGRVKIRSDRYINTEGVAHQSFLQVKTSPVIGTLLKLTVGGVLYSFEVVDGATINNQDGNLIPSNNTALDMYNYSLRLIPYLKDNNFIKQNFTLASAMVGLYDGIVFNAKNVGDEYDIDYTGNNATYFGEDIISRISGVDEVANENFEVRCRLFIETVKNANDFKEIITLKGSPVKFTGTYGESTFDFNEILSRYLAVTFPNFDDPNAIYVDTTVCKSFYYEYFESFGAIPIDKKVYTDTARFALLAGLNFLSFPGNSVIQTYLTQTIFGNSIYRWLTFAEDNMEVTKTQKIFYSFCNIGNNSSLKTRTTVYFTDGTTQVTDGSPSGTLAHYDVVVFPLGYTQLNLGAVNPSKVVDSYNVILLDGVSNVLKSRGLTFTLDTLHYRSERYFYFENSLGGIDCLRVTGEKENKINLEFLEFNKFTGFDYDQLKGQQQIFDSFVSFVNTVSTGWKSKEYIQYLLEFILSKQKYELLNGKLVPIILNTKSFSLRKDMDMLYELTFEYRYAFEDRIYSPFNSPILNDPNFKLAE